MFVFKLNPHFLVLLLPVVFNHEWIFFNETGNSTQAKKKKSIKKQWIVNQISCLRMVDMKQIIIFQWPYP